MQNICQNTASHPGTGHTDVKTAMDARMLLILGVVICSQTFFWGRQLPNSNTETSYQL